MRVLLASGGFRTPQRRELLLDQMRSFFASVETLLFIPFAVADHDLYVRTLGDRNLDGGYRLEGLHRAGDPVRALRDAEGLYVGGGNSFRLLTELYDRELIEVIREAVRSGLPYMGVSAGANVACPTIKTTNDMPIVQPPSFNALALVQFQINPHYFSGPGYFRSEQGFEEHFGETRDDRIAEFHEMNGAPVIGLREGSLLRVGDEEAVLVGRGARVFRKGQAPEDFDAGADLWPLLNSPDLQR